MSDTRVASRYAKSLLDLANEQGCLPDVERDIRLFRDTLAGSRELAVVLRSPVVTSDKKMAVLRRIFDGKITDLMMKFLAIMSNKAREAVLESVAKEFLAQYRTFKGIQQATVTSAAPITAAQRAEFEAKLVAQTGKKIELLEVIDPELIGGFILRVGDQQIDNSMASHLRRMRTAFNDETYVNKM